MRVRQVRRPPVRLAAAAGFLLLAVALAALAATQSAAPAGRSVLRGVSKPIPSKLPDGCGDAALTDGSGNTRPEILCGTAGADVIRAGIADRVKAGNGKDTIYARNGAPNEVDGGAGYDTAYVDGGKLDRPKGIQKRYTAMRPASGRLVTPKKFPYELPTVECDDDDEGPGRHILLLDPPGQKAQMAAYDANPGVVDWQNVAWATVIYKWDRQARKWNPYFESDWLWDRTYDLPDYTKRKHPPNVWRSLVEGEDADAAPQEPFAVVEPGFYNVRFRYYWYAETLADLTDMPKEYLFTPARKLLGKYTAGGVAANQRYCNFP